MIHIIFFGAEDCDQCKIGLKRLELSKVVEREDVDFYFIDCNNTSDEMEELLDSHGVDKFPHVKIYDGEELLFECVGNTMFYPKKIFLEIDKKKETAQ